MNYTTLQLDFHVNPDQELLIIYTGGTIGMRINEEGTLVPFNFEQFVTLVPELKQFNYNFTIVSFDTLIDSANMTPDHWCFIAQIIAKNYNRFDGFIVLQGTDTMAYTASGVSFLLENIHKPVVFTGSQLPIGAIRNDARKNLISSIEIAAQKSKGEPVIKEVTLFFNETLIRGNRAKKVQNIHLDAFKSENYPELARAGVVLEFNRGALFSPKGAFRCYTCLCQDVVILKLFPGIQSSTISSLINQEKLKGIILETYGAGNAPMNDQLLEQLKQFMERGGIIMNVSQCNGGQVSQKRYQTGNKLEELGVISGKDITSEAALAKLMFVLGNYSSYNDQLNRLTSNLRGELG